MGDEEHQTDLHHISTHGNVWEARRVISPLHIYCYQYCVYGHYVGGEECQTCPHHISTYRNIPMNIPVCGAWQHVHNFVKHSYKVLIPAL